MNRATSVRVLAAGSGWRVSDVVCRSGPDDAAFEEVHEWVSVAAVVAGTFAYRSSHGRALMTPGSVLLGNRGACFRCSHEHGQGDRCVAFHFDQATIESIVSDLKGVRRTSFARHRLPPSDALSPLFAATRALVASADPLLAEEAAFRMAGAALRAAHDADKAVAGLTDENRAAAAVALVEAAYMEPLTLARMADAAGLGRYHFLRVFRRAVGTTPYRYLLNRRLAAAADALRDGDSVIDAALASGFGDLSEFTRRFRSKFGQPPAAFRREASVRDTRAVAAPRRS